METIIYKNVCININLSFVLQPENESIPSDSRQEMLKKLKSKISNE